jgi:hypothetical protein
VYIVRKLYYLLIGPGVCSILFVGGESLEKRFAMFIFSVMFIGLTGLPKLLLPVNSAGHTGLVIKNEENG